MYQIKERKGFFLIRLKNVSKFYYSKGMIASGFSKVNLNFDVGEFVVITGESGSGKTTLLNVISGLDSYEEGELYIEGKETSHYLASDFEEYRKKYIGNIFQHFNLVNSYTVYQNVELILRVNGYKKEEMKDKVCAILERVGLSSYARTKVSKLSGGQKQRVSIARALAKDTAVVVADEPTGNLDSESAEGIVRLLSEISRDKLVIVVTHNYEQFETYATRKIKMHDGKVVEDEQLRKTHLPADLPHSGAELQDQSTSIQPQPCAGKMSAASKLRLGIRNTFNILPKFLLLLIVFLFVVLAVSSEYTTFKHSDAETAKMGYNEYFSNYQEDRIILKKQDNSAFTDRDYQILSKAAHVKSVVKEDIMLDNSIFLESAQFGYDAYPRNAAEFKGKLAYGRMPEKENEVILAGSKEDYYFQEENISEILDHKFRGTLATSNYMPKLKIVGIAYEETQDNLYFYGGTIYLQQSMLDKMVRETYGYGSTITTTVNDNALVCAMGDTYCRPVVNENVKPGEALVSEEFNSYYKDGKAAGQEISIKAENIFYKKTLKVTTADTYNQKSFTSKTGLDDFEANDGAVFLNKADYNKLFKTDNYQVSVYTGDIDTVEAVASAFEKQGYKTLVLKDTLINMTDQLVSIIQVPMTVVLLIAVFFIAYFVIQLILRSRVSYFSILRMLGLEKRGIRRILDVELFTILNIAYALFLTLILLVNYDVLQVAYLKTLIEYMSVPDYAILYGVLLVMSYLISGKFARKLFKKTAMGSYREEEA